MRPSLALETTTLTRRPSVETPATPAAATHTRAQSVVKPRRRPTMSLGRRRDLLGLCSVALCLALFRLGLDLSSVGGPTVRARRFSELRTWPTALASVARTPARADEGHVQFWPEDTPEDLAAPKCIQYNTRSQCVAWSNPADADPSFLGSDPEQVERERREEEELARLSADGRDFVRSTRWLVRDWPVTLKWNEVR